MSSAGIRQLASGRWQVYWRSDGQQGSETFDTKDDAVDYRDRVKMQWKDGTWLDPSRSRIKFADWAAQWWDTWSADGERSPNTLASTELRLNQRVLPTFGRMQLRAIRPQHIQRWQNKLKDEVGYPTVMASRSILFRILRAAEHDGRIASNPAAKVEPPKKPVDIEARFGRTKRRTFTPEEFGRFLAAVPPFYRDHFLTQVGTGLRPSELLGLHVSRVDLERGHLEVLDVRYDAGKKYGSGYKDRPKSTASIRPVPLSPVVAKAVTRRVEAADEQKDSAAALVFPGPGGSRGLARGQGSGVKLNAGVGMSVSNYRRKFKQALADVNRASNPAHRLTHLDPHGPHALRATFSTWLEDAGVPSRVIDELMGHEDGRPGGEVSRMGALYRETTSAMLDRAVAAVDTRLTLALAAADEVLTEMDNLRKERRRKGGPKKKPQAL